MQDFLTTVIERKNWGVLVKVMYQCCIDIDNIVDGFNVNFDNFSAAAAYDGDIYHRNLWT